MEPLGPPRISAKGTAGASRAPTDLEGSDMTTTKLSGGELLSTISTRIVGLLRDHYGRGPMKAKTYALDDIIVCVMRGSGFTPIEKTMMESGEPNKVVDM